ncbi:MAG: ABC transporter ATP-binding protein [Acidaminococcaceae bacterium]|nr:ABC transporter ATP-binding protein [Acidaminococcaceae bacterium]
MLRDFFHYYKPYKAILCGVIIGSFVTAALDLVFPVLVREILNVELPQKNMEQIFRLSVLLFALYVVNAYLVYAINYYGRVMSAGIENDMRRELFAHLERQSFRFFDNSKTGQLLSRITSDIVEISELTFRGPNDVFVCTVTMFGTMGILFYMNIYLGTLVSFLLLAKTFHSVIVNKKLKALYRRSRVKSGELSAQTEESLSGVRLVKAFANEDVEIDRFMEKSNELYFTRRQSFGLTAYFGTSISFFTNFTNLSVLCFGGYLISVDSMTLSDFVAFLLYINLFMKPILRLMVFTEMYQKGMAGLERFFEMKNCPLEIVDMPGAIEDKDIQGEITFENVTFGYLDGRPVLKNFNLKIQPGQKVAFVGSTGAGKTTIANLLLRFYEPSEGRILLDGIDIREYQQALLRRKVGLVQQDVFLFSDSVRFNIAYGKMDAADEEIRNAAKLAVADDFIAQLPEEYDTCIGERGVKLSGGQKQRLAIARAFLKNPPVIVLDEATSALDNKTEKMVQASLEKLSENRTTLIIAHRLSTVINADIIIVLQDGRAVERGTHEELLAAGGVYKKLYDISEYGDN